MTAVFVALLVGITAGLIASELTDIAAWVAKRLVHWAARRWSTDEEQATAYAEEWERIIEDRPGKLLKLATALGLASGALARAVSRTARDVAYWLLRALRLLGRSRPPEVLSGEDRQDVMEDLADLDFYQALLGPTGIRGLVVDCDKCHQSHYFDWDLLRGNLRHLLRSGVPSVHEPAFNPVPDHYVTWDFARGYADGQSGGIGT